jgi:SpoVK/Ycf46/Vps4 family AAA+-type ATPase
MTSPLQSFFVNQRTNYVFKLCKLETNLDLNKEQYAVEMASIVRIGDEKPITVPANFLKQRYDMLSEEEAQELIRFLAENPNRRNLPVKYKMGLFDLGHESEAYRPQNISDPIAQEFEKLVTEDTQSLKFGVLSSVSNVHSFDKIVATAEVVKSIKVGMAKIKYQDFLNNQWNLKSINENFNKSILNFYGPPGTGKTLSAKAVAFELKKKILQVDYSQVESKWVGETGKNIQKVFQLAKQHDAVLLFDEADSLVSKRLDSGNHNAHFVNENRNIFMQELDKFSGVVILTTNLFENYDEALLRRVSQHIKFELPSLEQRVSLFKYHIPQEVKTQDLDFKVLAQNSENCSGGDIKVICEEAMVQACVEAETLEQAILKPEHLLNEIKKVKQAKNTHQGVKKPMGIGVVHD